MIEKNGPLQGVVALFNGAHSFGKDAHGMVREKGNIPSPARSDEPTLAIIRVTGHKQVTLMSYSF